MNNPVALTAFEHDTLRVGSHFDAIAFRELARYHDTVSGAYFDLGFNCIKLKHYVGLIHVQDLSIEVLPKIDRLVSGSDTTVWRTVLLEMLVASGILNADILKSAPQAVGKTPLFDILALQFAHATDALVCEGLLRKYRSEKANIASLKGKLLFSQHINRNLTKPDHWYTDHTVYDHNHALNGILKAALDAMYPVCSSSVKQRLRSLQLEFLDIPPFLPNAAFMERLRYDRRTERYRQAIALAWLVLRDLCPAISIGQTSIFAIMFDMNKLFEQTVIRLLSLEARKSNDGIQVLGKESTSFWRRMHLRPDILLEKNGMIVIVDTKWKLLSGGIPNEHDVRQVFAYSLYFSAPRVVLLYPGNNVEEGQGTPFAAIPKHPDLSISCSIGYANLVTKNGTLNGEFAKAFLSQLFPASTAPIPI